MGDYTASAITTAHGAGSPPNKDVVKSAADSLASHLDSAMSHMNHEFYHYDYGAVQDADDGYDNSESDELEYIKDVTRDLVENEGHDHTDPVVIAHNKWKWGYGRAAIFDIDGKGYRAATVYAGDQVVQWEMEGFTWHEALHCLDCKHYDADYKFDGYVLREGYKRYKVHDINPMAMGYKYDWEGEVDTHHPGGDDPPETFCCEDKFLENYEDTWKHNSKKSNHDTDETGACTKDTVEGWIEYMFNK